MSMEIAVSKNEKWGTFHGPSGFIVSTTGKVKDRDGDEIPSWLNDKGYPIVDFLLPPVHRMVAITFIPNPQNLRTVNHKNGIKHDNRIENLEWMSIGENVLHSRRVLGVNCGAIHPRATIDDMAALTIFTCLTNKKVNYAKLAMALGVSSNVVSHIARGNSWHNLREVVGFTPFRKQKKGRRKVYVKKVGKIYLEAGHA